MVVRPKGLAGGQAGDPGLMSAPRVERHYHPDQAAQVCALEALLAALRRDEVPTRIPSPSGRASGQMATVRAEALDHAGAEEILLSEENWPIDDMPTHELAMTPDRF